MEARSKNLKRKQDSNESSNKKVRFNNVTSVSHFENTSANKNRNDNRKKKYNNFINDDEEEDDIEDFEKLKNRRGRVNLDGYNTDSDSEEEENENNDIFAEEGENEAFLNKKKKGTFMKRSDIQGEEWNNPDNDEDEDNDEEKMEPFNMDRDLEEGDFDENGHYIPKKDENQIYDNWLQGVTQSDIKKARVAHEAQEAKIKAEDEKEDEDLKQNDLYKALLMIMKPGETLLNSMKRLGGSTKKVPKWKQKMLAKKAKSSGKEAPEVSEKDKKSIEAITVIAEKMMSFGNYSIYEESYESIVRKLRIAEDLEDEWKPGDKINISFELFNGIPEIRQALES